MGTGGAFWGSAAPTPGDGGNPAWPRHAAHVSETPPPSPSPAAALASLARDVGIALVKFANTVDSTANTGETSAGMGPRQRAILALEQLRGEDGMSTKQIGDAIGYRTSSTTAALKRLAELGRLEQVPEVRPAHWRRS